MAYCKCHLTILTKKSKRLAVYLDKLFSDSHMVEKIQAKLPLFFQMAEAENSRAGKLGMEIGSARERILIALLMYYFGRENIDADLSINAKEVDVIVFDQGISIKTLSGGLSGVKLIWTTDKYKVEEFVRGYKPCCDMIFASIKWGKLGLLAYIPQGVQARVLKDMDAEDFFKIPRENTNPRGVEISKRALEACLEDKGTYKIPIEWIRDKNLVFDPYEKWLRLWEEE